MSWDIELDDQLLQDLYAWIDQIPLSRPKKHIEKDFSDGVMVAELIKHYFPTWVDIHNYTTANNTQQKLINWGLLNRKILCRLDLNVPEPVMRGICLGRTGLVEIFLYNLRNSIDDCLSGEEKKTNPPRNRAQPQQVKATESNVKTSRQHQWHSPPPQQQQQQQQHHEQYPSGYANSPSYVSYHDQDFEYDHDRNESKGMIQGGHIGRKSTSMQNLSTDMVSRGHYDEKEQECRAKDQQIQVLQAKINRLEQLLRLKDVRVDDLSGKLDQSRGLPGGHPGRTGRPQYPQMPMNGRK